ncbi:TonB-dependent receptor [Gloeocapsa sp. BRSZ]
MNNYFRCLILLTNLLWISSIQTALAEIISVQQAAELPRGIINKPTLAQNFIQSPAQVTGISLQPTANGLEILLTTINSEALQTATRIEGNSFIADIPNAQLRLATGDSFTQETPLAGVAQVIVTNLDANNIRVQIIGIATAPQVELFDSDAGLVFAVANTAAQTEKPIEIIVTATRTEEQIENVPRSLTVINREQIEAQSAITNDLGDILGRTVPGLGPPNSLNRAGNAQTLRGRPVSILIDGVPQQGNSFVNTQLEYIAPDAIERVEVVRGPTAIYGQGASGGIINIITRRPTEAFTSTAQLGISAAAGGDAFLQGGSFGNLLQYGISGTEGSFDYIFSISRRSVDSFFDADGDRIPTNNATSDDTVSSNVLGKVGINITDRQRLQFTVNHGNNSRDVNYIADPITRTIPGTQKTRALRENQDYQGADDPRITSTSLSLSYTNENLFGSILQAQAYYRQSEEVGIARDDRGRFADSINRFRAEEEALGGRLQIQTPLSTSLSLLWGADYEQQQEGNSIQELFDPVAFDNSSNEQRILRKIGENIFYPAFDLNSLGLFAQLQWDLSEQLLLSGGLRYERFNFGVDQFTPLYDDNFDPYVGSPVAGGEIDFNDTVFNLGAVYQVTPQVSFYANFAQGYSVPQLFRVLNFLPPGFAIEEDVRFLQPQKIDNYEIGIRSNWNNVQVTLAGFYNFSDLGLSSRGQPDGTIQFIRAPQRNYGIEATIDWQPVTNWLLGSSLTWTEGEDDQDEDRNYLALRTLEVQPLKITAYIENQTTPGWRNRLQLLYVGNRDRGFTAGSDFVSIGDYAVLDYISSLQIGSGTLEIGIQNLLNNKYSSVFSQAGGGLDELLNNWERGRTLSINYRISW